MVSTVPGNAAWPGRVLVMGAGAIGCYLGGRLANAGAAVHLVARGRVLADLRAHGLTVVEADGRRSTLPPGRFEATDSVPRDIDFALVLLCVKSRDTPAAARMLGDALPRGTPVLSMQNGLHNAGLAQVDAPALRVLPGMVPYNVAEIAPATWLRGSAGELALQDDPITRAWAGSFRLAGLPVQLHDDMSAVQWAKLLLNLNNPVNALSGLPLRSQLLDRDLRATTAALIAEALALLARARQPLARLTPIPPRWLPALMRLPTPVFSRLAARMLRIDPRARSSMADDLARGQPTEIDALCGEVLRLAGLCGGRAPRNERMVALVRAAEQSGTPGQTWAGAALRREIESAR